MAQLCPRHARDFSGRLATLKLQYNIQMSQTGGVLIVGDPAPKRNDFGAAVVRSFTDAKTYLQTHQPSVLVFGQTRANGFDEFCSFLLSKLPASLWIVACEGLPPSQIVKWNNIGRLHDLVENFEDPALEGKLKAAFEMLGEQVQKRKLVELFADETRQFQRLSAELEARVQKRQKALRKSMLTNDETKTRLESFHKALIGIHRAASVLQMEQTLSEVLRDSVNIVWVRVRFTNQSLMGQQIGKHVLRIEIPFPGKVTRGEVYFSKSEGDKFSTAEVDFLHELTEALALALSRLHSLEQAETVKAQWQATFDAIPHALCLATADFEITKLNRAFQVACSSRSFRALIGKNSFAEFFGPGFNAPAATTSPFTFRSSRDGNAGTEHYEVVSEPLGLKLDNQAVQLILIRSITEDVRYERRLLEASKFAELGTIGSSIAHELNNPLGGMLSFLQLILMDIKPTDDVYSEIKQMEAAVFRCRDIVLNLLSFARKQDLGEFSPLDLWDVVERSVKLIELQSKSKGILIDLNRQNRATVRGSINALSQSLCNVLQNSIDAISEKIAQDPLFPGKITLTLDEVKGQYQLSIADNGTGIRPEIQTQVFNPRFTTRDPGVYNGMGLTTAFTIVSEHHGSLEILSQTGFGTTAILSLPVL